MGKGGHHGIPLQKTVNQEVHARKKKDIGGSSCGAAMPHDKEVPPQYIVNIPDHRTDRMEHVTSRDILLIRSLPHKRRQFLLHSNIFLRKLNEKR